MLTSAMAYYQSFRAISRRVGADERGVAAIEFAMILPIMFVLLVGTVELGQAVGAERRVYITAVSTADLIGRAAGGKVELSQIDLVKNVSQRVMAPYDGSQVKVTIVSVLAKSNGAGNVNIEVLWSRDTDGNEPKAKGAPYADGKLAGMLPNPGDSAIISEVKFHYVPMIFTYFIEAAFDLTHRSYQTSRAGEAKCVVLSPMTQAEACPEPLAGGS